MEPQETEIFFPLQAGSFSYSYLNFGSSALYKFSVKHGVSFTFRHRLRQISLLFKKIITMFVSVC